MNLVDSYSCRLLSFRAPSARLGFYLNKTISSPMGFFPGGPSPDSALPSHSKPIDPRHGDQAKASAPETHHHQGSGEMASQQRQQELAASGPQPITRELPSDLPPQPFEHLATSADTLPGHPFSDEHAEISPDVRVAGPNTEAAAEGSPSLGKEARHSASVASRRTDDSLPTNDVGGGASAAGAVTAANGPPDVDPNLQARAVSVEGELRQKATTGKDKRTFSSNPLLPSRPFISTKLLNTATGCTQMASAESYRKSIGAVPR